MTVRDRIIRKNKEDIEFLCDSFIEMAKCYSYLYGKFDEDLYSEQLLAMLKGLHKFQFNEDEFSEIYDIYLDNEIKKGRN